MRPRAGGQRNVCDCVEFARLIDRKDPACIFATTAVLFATAIPLGPNPTLTVCVTVRVFISMHGHAAASAVGHQQIRPGESHSGSGSSRSPTNRDHPVLSTGRSAPPSPSRSAQRRQTCPSRSPRLHALAEPCGSVMVATSLAPIQGNHAHDIIVLVGHQRAVCSPD